MNEKKFARAKRMRSWNKIRGEFYYFTLFNVFLTSWEDERANVDENNIEFSTDLFDKNGHEIYQGDILKMKDAYGRDKINSVVMPDIYYFSIEYAFLFNDCEVVGNIYQNEDLIK